MQAKLTINGMDMTPWLARGGLVHTPLVRQSRIVVTLDGREYRTEIVVHGLEVRFVEMRDRTLAAIRKALSSPATVLFTDDFGDELTRVMYVTGPTVTTKVVQGGNTYYNGVSITLEER